MRERSRLIAAGAVMLVVTALALGTNAGAGPRGYFPCPVLLFFAPCPAIDEAPDDTTPVPAGRSESVTGLREVGAPRVEALWAEPRSGIESGGPMYVPPRPVREFLESPTPERARAYLAWNQARLRAIAQAAEVLRLVTASEMTGGADPPASMPAGCAAPTTTVGAAVGTPAGEDPLPAGLTAVADPSRTSHGVTVLYAFASWCPSSARQTPLVAAWARRRPDVPVTGLLFDSPPGATVDSDGLPFPVRAGSLALRERLGVRRYPTLLILKGGAPVERLTGLTSMARLDAIIRALGA